MSKQFSDLDGRQPRNTGVVIGIPAYNEEEMVATVVRRASEVAETVIIVDDGSDDRTAALAEWAGASVVRHEQNRGYGAALKSIFQAADDRDADHLVIVDADGQHDPREAPNLIDTQRASNAEIVIGSRFVSGSQTDSPLYRRIGLAMINFIVGILLIFNHSTERIHDTQSGFRVYDADAIELLAREADLSNGMDASVDILFQAAAADCEFVEVPAEVTYDVEEANTRNPFVHGAVLVRNVAVRLLSERPLRVVGVCGSAFLLFGVMLAGATVFGLSPLQTIPRLAIVFLILMGGSLTGMALAAGASHLST